MMKKYLVVLIAAFLAGPVILQGQASGGKFNSRELGGRKLTGENLEAKSPTSGNCAVLDGDRLALPTLRKQIGNIALYLNVTNSFIELNGRKFLFNIPEDRVDKPGRNWRYHINDIRSEPDKNRLTYKNGKFFLFVEFEGDEKEYKGLCPGCLPRFQDSRAPDFNWESPRIAKITLEPRAYGGEVYFHVTEVELSGKFEMGGRMDELLIPMLNGMEIKLKNQLERQFRKIFNDPHIRPALSKAFDGFVKMQGVSGINRIYDTNGQLFFCN